MSTKKKMITDISAELDKKYASSKCFQASTSYGFQPGYTTKGLNDVKWDNATF